jgi:phage-related tail protein
VPIMDELRKKTEESLKTLREVAEDIAHNLEIKAKITKKKYLDIGRLKKAIADSYREIGEYVYDQHMSGRTLDMETPFIKERVEDISKMKRRIKEIEEEIETLEKMREEGVNRDLS